VPTLQLSPSFLEDLNGRRILVTGASTGIGAAAAIALARCGARIALHFNRNEKAAQSVAAEIGRLRGTAILLKGNLGLESEPRRVVEQAAQGLGGLDVLINNAGSLIRRTPFAEVDDQLINEILSLNVRAIITACQAAIPHLEKRPGSTIINVGSIAGNDGGGPGAGIYASAKAFVHNLTRHLARDLGPKGIRVNAVAPGVIDTPFHAATPPERMETMRKAIHLGRIGKAEDCAGAFLFLASPAMSGYITGQVIHVNGGQLMSG
jgi:3-oxoacyl-[acyl-carrier protein] reductase